MNLGYICFSVPRSVSLPLHSSASLSLRFSASLSLSFSLSTSVSFRRLALRLSIS